ncbi:Uncharacterised protein [Mycobacteroides abscessus subsp. abscessus]|nr:Uncharacterised protein [Mycobacteroides abscessus subsp. abscessus]
MAGAQVGDVADQRLPRRIRVRVEVAFQPIGENLGLLIDDGSALVGALLDRSQPQFAHQIGHQSHRAGELVVVELGRDPPASRSPALLCEDPYDLALQRLATRLRRREGPDSSPPRVERRPGHAQLLTHPADRIVSLLRLDQG